MVDQDGDLLACATRGNLGGGIGARLVEVRTGRVDLATAGMSSLLATADLVTASALFDLVSPGWAKAVLEAVAGRRGALLAVLTYDGRMGWAPDDPVDRRVRALVNRHQRTDKSFGPALGPAAAGWLKRQARASGARVRSRPSDWRLAAAEAAVQRALLPGLAEAASSIALGETAAIQDWCRRRLAAAGQGVMRIGHQDLFAAW
jgi:hypothetical protein